jgi:hypothetical protein
MSGIDQRRFGSQQELISLIVSIEELDPVHRQGDSGEILFHLALQKIGPHLVQDVAEPVVHFRKQNRLIDACGVLEGDKLHGIAVLGVHRLAGDQPSDGGDMLTEVSMKVTCGHVMQSS